MPANAEGNGNRQRQSNFFLCFILFPLALNSGSGTQVPAGCNPIYLWELFSLDTVQIAIEGMKHGIRLQSHLSMGVIFTTINGLGTDIDWIKKTVAIPFTYGSYFYEKGTNVEMNNLIRKLQSHSHMGVIFTSEERYIVCGVNHNKVAIPFTYGSYFYGYKKNIIAR